MYQPNDTIVTNIRTGDVVSFPNPPETYSDNPAGTFKPGELMAVTNTWWHDATNRYVIQLDHEHQDAILAFEIGQLDIARIHDRRQVSSPTATYVIGQRVRVNWMHRINELGTVTEITYLPPTTPGLPGEYCYTVKTVYGDAWVSSENISPEPSPAPAVGQQWMCLLGASKGTLGTCKGTIMTVLKVIDPITARCRNEKNGRVNRILLSSQWYGITVATAPKPDGKLGVDFYEAEVEVMYNGQDPVSHLVRIF